MRQRRSIITICVAIALLVLAVAPTAHAAFGIQAVDFSVSSKPPVGSKPGAVGPPETQAGAHPYQVTVSFAFNETTDVEGSTIPDGEAKDLQVELPPGLMGSLVNIPQCPVEAFENSALFSQGCPADAQVGMLTLDTTFINVTVPVFNLEPPPEVAAQLGVFALVSPVVMGVSVRTGGDYGLTVNLRNIPQVLPVFGGSLSLWGVPADEMHDSLRGTCLSLEGGSSGKCPSGAPHKPFLTLPGSCGKPLQATLRTDSWQQPGTFVARTGVQSDSEGNALDLLGCDRLDFSPTIETQTESTTIDTPSALAAHVHIPQNENPDGLAEAGVHNAVVVLPTGVSINPAAADGLGACRPEEILLNSPAKPACPDSSRIGSVEIDSPLIADPLRGSIYLASPHDNPFESMFAVYFVAERDGILIKLAGRLDADPETGQLRVTLSGMPQLPFSDIVFSFDGGPRAPLAMPARCGTFTTVARLTSQAAPEDAVPATPSSSFTLNRGCSSGFSPSFVGGATSSLPGRHTGLILRLSRADGEQTIRSFSAALPSGLLPLLGSIPLCAEIQAAAGTCEASSRIGSITIAAGAGSHPFNFAGKVFLTEAYEGAPFGLSIVVPGIAGPLDLGTIVARAKVSVDPGDAHLTISTDSLPQILQGIPLRIREFSLTTDRPGLLLSPTSCEGQHVLATVVGGGGSTVSLSSPFGLNGCPGLRFSPRVSASTNARATQAGGVSLNFAVRDPHGAQANLRAITVAFPRQFSPRLAAIQGACAQATFAADPASCPPASIVGRTTVRTPVLGVPMTGSAYLVSRGQEALPRLVLMLRAHDVLLRITGSLHITTAGTTTATFGSMPDARISRFALKLSRGPSSVFGANFLGNAGGSLCGRNFTMHTRVLAQNGSRIRRSVQVSVRGCAKR
jgi:hypothetical protein